jgi:hypothetical protein
MGNTLKIKNMKLNFNKSLQNLDNSEIENSNMGKLLANVLSQANTGEPVKCWEMALKLFDGQELEVDTTDREMLESTIKASQGLTNAGKAQLLLVIKNAQ